MNQATENIVILFDVFSNYSYSVQISILYSYFYYKIRPQNFKSGKKGFFQLFQLFNFYFP